jgi:hypothetical protein
MMGAFLEPSSEHACRPFTQQHTILAPAEVMYAQASSTSTPGHCHACLLTDHKTLSSSCWARHKCTCRFGIGLLK